jgi:heme/copper-type cytochrome/quinol oxidase subunit 2
MRGKVVVDTESDYQAWLGKQKTFAQSTEQPRKFGEIRAELK